MRATLTLFAALAGVAPCAASPQDKDLLPAAELALHGFMINWPEPVQGEDGIMRTCFGCVGLPFPTVSHAQWDWGDCTGRAVEAWLYLREMTGDRATGSEVEEGQRRALLWLLAPDTGMPCVPENSDRAKGEYYYQMWDQGRTLRALVRWLKAEPDPAVRRNLTARIEKMIAGLDSVAVHGEDPTFGPYVAYATDWWIGDRRGDDVLCPRAGQLMEPLAMYVAATGSKAARGFADRVLAGVLGGHDGDAYTDTRKGHFRFGDDGSFFGHFHAHVSTALGVAKYGAALYKAGERTRGLELLRWARRVYDWTLSPTNVNVASTWGWFPENVTDGAAAREVCEICCAADMIEYAAFLAEASTLDPSLAGWDTLWDDVERYTVNTILPAQFRVTPEYTKLLGRIGARTPSVSNGYVSLEVDPAGCYNHEVTGHETFRAGGEGHVAQAVYGVAYNGKRAWYQYAGGGPIAAHGLKVEKASAAEGGIVKGSVATDDGALQIGCETRCGDGPYVVRTFTVENSAGTAIPGVRFAFAANLDFATWNADRGVANSELGRVVVTPQAGPGALGMAGTPKPTRVGIGGAAEIVGGLGSLDWDRLPTELTGNPAGMLVWDLGELASGAARQVSVTIGWGTDEGELGRALAQEAFPERAAPAAANGELEAAQRLTGAWVAAFPPNDLCGLQPDGTPYINMMGCCAYAGVRGLYACWSPALHDDGRVLESRIPIDRASAAADQEVTQTLSWVTQEIRMKAGRELRVRIPNWADPESVRLSVDGRELKPAQLEGRWLDVGRVPAGTEVVVRYPVRTRVTVERVGGAGTSLGFCPPDQKRTFTAHWRGNIVTALEPTGTLMPVFR